MADHAAGAAESTVADRKPSRWRATRRRARGSRLRAAIAMALIFAALAAAFAWLVARPLWHPRVRFAVVSAGAYQMQGAPPIAFAEQDAAAFDRVARALGSAADADRGGAVRHALASPAAARGLRARLAPLVASGDVLIVYVAALGLVDDGVPYLACDNFDAANPLAGRVRLSDVLTQIAAVEASVKLVLLDTAGPADGVRLGATASELPRLVDEEVRRLADERLWVLHATADFERSHVSFALERSVFAHFATRGLAGAADANGDRVVTVNELYGYVARNTSAWVAGSSSDIESQTPRLYATARAARRTAAAELAPVAAPAWRDMLSADAAGASGKVGDQAQSQAESLVAARLAPLATRAAPVTALVPNGGGAPARGAANASLERGDAHALASPAADEAAAGGAPVRETDGAASAASRAGTPSNQTPAPATSVGAAPVSPAIAESTAPAAADSSVRDRANAIEPAPRSGGELLAAAWRRRDQLLDRRRGANVLDFAPEAMRDLEVWLLRCEQLLRSGADDEVDQTTAQLELTVALLDRLAAGESMNLVDEATARTNAARAVVRIDRAAPREGRYVASRVSLAVAAWAAEHGGEPLLDETAQLAEALAALAVSGEEADFVAWAHARTEAERRFLEVDYAVRLAGVERVAWPTRRAALALRLSAEKAWASSASERAQLSPALSEADRARRAADRMLFLEPSRASAADIDRRLSEAAGLYRKAGDDARTVERARQAANDGCYRSRWYVDWFWTAPLRPRERAVVHAACSAWLDELARLAAQLDSGASIDVDLLARRTERLALLGDRAGALFDAASSERRASAAACSPGVYVTPLWPAARRFDEMAHGLACEQRWAGAWQDVQADGFEPARAASRGDDWTRLDQCAGLEVQLAKLAAIDRGAVEAIAEAAAAARSAAVAFAEGRSTDEAAHDPLAAYGRLFGLLAGFYRDLPREIDGAVAGRAAMADAELRPAYLERLRLAQRATIFVDPRDAMRTNLADAGRILRDADLYDALVALRARLLADARDATNAHAAWLGDLALTVAADASRIAGQPPIPTSRAARLALVGAAEIDLTQRAAVELPIEVWLDGADRAEAEIDLLFDVELLDVELRSSASVSAAPSQRSNAAGNRAPVGTVRVSAPHPADLALIVRRKDTSPLPTRIIVSAVSAVSAAQHEIAVRLPPPALVELRVAGIADSWAPSAGGVALYPFANRTTAYRLSLANLGDKPLQADVELFALAEPLGLNLPDAPLPIDPAAALIEQVQLGAALVDARAIDLPAGGVSVPLAAPPPQSDAPSSDSTLAAGSAANSKDGAGSAAISLDHGILAVITDRTAQNVILRHLSFAPQKPRRYVTPRVSYDLERQRIEIRVAANDRAAIAADGIPVAAEVVDALHATRPIRLTSKITRDDGEALLYATIPTEANASAVVTIDVDGFPRAFRYTVPCTADVRNASEEVDRVAIRCIAPTDGSVFRAPLAELAAEFQVDAPPSAFDDASDVVEIGLDLDQSRDFRGEPVLRFYSDRMASVGFQSLSPAGVLTVDASVADFKVSLPAGGVADAAVGVLGRVDAARREAWSESATILLDASPPVIDAIELAPMPAAVIGTEADISVAAVDAAAGVAKVEAAFDVSRTGEFTAEPAPVELAADGAVWRGKLPTADLAAGPTLLMVRATDKVGNVSDTRVMRVDVLTQEQAAASGVTTVRLAGTVFYGGAPAPAIVVVLTGDSESQQQSVASDAQGNFAFGGVPPGKYQIEASGVVRNKERQATADVEIAAPPARPKPLRLALE